jgi:hypothetical protein
MIAMTSKELNPIEIYPKIFVYKNVFSNIEKTYELLKESTGDDLFSPWTKWSHFGQYLFPTFKDYHHGISVESVESIETKTEKEEDQRLAILELLNIFYKTTADYAIKNGIDLDTEKYITDQYGNQEREWRRAGPSIARYRTDIEDPIAMTYHSDYIREPIKSPNHKFIITALAYFNDDYEGGEIDFIVAGEAFMYKPEAGDFLIFPSGDPELLTKDGSVYIHGVMPPSGDANKYISRMYWMKYEDADPLWFEKEAEFGKEVWAEMQEDIMQKFRDDNPNKISSEKERRVS